MRSEGWGGSAQDAAVFPDPVEVSGGGCGESAFGGTFAWGTDGIRDDPSVALGVTVGKGEGGGSVVV